MQTIESLELVWELAGAYQHSIFLNLYHRATAGRWPVNADSPQRPPELVTMEEKARSHVEKIRDLQVHVVREIGNVPDDCLLHVQVGPSSVLLPDGTREWRAPLLCDSTDAERAKQALERLAVRIEAGESNGSALGGKTIEPPKFLNEAQREAFLYVRDEGPVPSKSIAEKVGRENGTVREWCAQGGKLYEAGVRNDGAGYYVADKKPT